jgi:hypothetical protein
MENGLPSFFPQTCTLKGSPRLFEVFLSIVLYKYSLNLLGLQMVHDCVDKKTKLVPTEKHLSQEGLHETVGFEKAHFSFRKC